MIDRQVFDTVTQLWASRLQIMNTRRRLKRYTYGDQWGDIVCDDEGRRVVESELLRRNGRRPITNNLIRRLVKTLVGRFREMGINEGWYDATLAVSPGLSELDELDSRLFEEFLISGMAIQRIADDNPLAGGAPAVENVNPECFFCNDFCDPRGTDIDLIGMLHDMSPAEVRRRFGGTTAKSREALSRILAASGNDIAAAPSTMARFHTPARGRVRIIEAWSREYDTNGNISWRVRWFAPNGALISSYYSPWRHRAHPFVVKFYPLTDGEIHSFVEDVVDQQRYINRIVVLLDRMMATSAKGVLVFPQGQKIKGMEWDEVARLWASPDGIIPIQGEMDGMPQQISGTNGDMSIYRLLEMELKLFEQSAGVGPALLGSSNVLSSARGAEMYSATVENATIALADIFYTFRSLLRHRDAKLSQL